MKTRIIERQLNGNSVCVIAQMPSIEDVDTLKVGDNAPDAFGGMSLVTRISANGKDRDGYKFVHYVTRLSEHDNAENGCGCSQSMKEEELIRSVRLTNLLTSAECDSLEYSMQSGKTFY